MKYGFGVDVGGTTVKLGLFDETGALLARREIPSRTENGGEAILPDIAAAIEAILREKGIGKAERAKVGRDMERIVHYHDGTAQKRSCVRSKALQVVKREKILQQRLRSF